MVASSSRHRRLLVRTYGCARHSSAVPTLAQVLAIGCHRAEQVGTACSWLAQGGRRRCGDQRTPLGPARARPSRARCSWIPCCTRLLAAELPGRCARRPPSNHGVSGSGGSRSRHAGKSPNERALLARRAAHRQVAHAPPDPSLRASATQLPSVQVKLGSDARRKGGCCCAARAASGRQHCCQLHGPRRSRALLLRCRTRGRYRVPNATSRASRRCASRPPCPVV